MYRIGSVTLDGTQSYDPNPTRIGRSLTYHWTLEQCLGVCTIPPYPITGADTATPSLPLFDPGVRHFSYYTFKLVVNNGRTDSTNYARTIVHVVGHHIGPSPK